jgi:hypothetical protein
MVADPGKPRTARTTLGLDDRTDRRQACR